MPVSLRNFKLNWKLTLFTVLMLPLMLKLGFWQLDREQEKLALQTLYESRLAAQPQRLGELDWSADLSFMPVLLTGSFDNEQLVLLDNRIYGGQAGYEVLQPFYTTDGALLWVNRGWVQAGRTRAELPVITPLPGELTLSGNIYVPVGETFLLGDEAEADSGWPRRVQSLEPELMLNMLASREYERFFPYSVRLAADSAGVLTRNWSAINTGPETHRGYAIQWFSMALVLLGLYLYVSTRPETETGREAEQEKHS